MARSKLVRPSSNSTQTCAPLETRPQQKPQLYGKSKGLPVIRGQSCSQKTLIPCPQKIWNTLTGSLVFIIFYSKKHEHSFFHGLHLLHNDCLLRFLIRMVVDKLYTSHCFTAQSPINLAIVAHDNLWILLPGGWGAN